VPRSMPRPHPFASTPTSGPRIQLVSAPMEPAPEQSWIGKADLDKARALLSRARKELEPRQWEQLDRKLTSFPGWDVLVNGKNFDALQLATRTLWDVKTDDFDKHSSRSQDFLARVKLPELQREDRLARQCGYDFIVGVKSAAHKAMLFKLDRTLKVVVMDWC
ncbi:MAG TPA: DUF6310 domain-containing protein, partial [Archangium sp.]|nr:DUF6310 domain-containing protein [Archangium sp.]